MSRSMKEVHTINYYPINEGAARRAKEMNSFSDYKEGSATAEYRAMVDKAAAIAEKQKSRVYLRSIFTRECPTTMMSISTISINNNFSTS